MISEMTSIGAIGWGWGAHDEEGGDTGAGSRTGLGGGGELMVPQECRAQRPAPRNGNTVASGAGKTVASEVPVVPTVRLSAQLQVNWECLWQLERPTRGLVGAMTFSIARQSLIRYQVG